MGWRIVCGHFEWEKKIPDISQSKKRTILQQPPDASAIKVASTSMLTAKRHLFTAPADNKPQPSEKVTEWLSKQDVVHYPGYNRLQHFPVTTPSGLSLLATTLTKELKS